MEGRKDIGLWNILPLLFISEVRNENCILATPALGNVLLFLLRLQKKMIIILEDELKTKNAHNSSIHLASSEYLFCFNTYKAFNYETCPHQDEITFFEKPRGLDPLLSTSPQETTYNAQEDSTSFLCVC